MRYRELQTATANSAGVAVFTFNAVPAGMVDTVSCSVPGAPPTAVVQAVDSAPIGTWYGSSICRDVQVVGGDQLVVTVSGLTAGTQYQAVTRGRRDDASVAPVVYEGPYVVSSTSGLVSTANERYSALTGGASAAGVFAASINSAGTVTVTTGTGTAHAPPTGLLPSNFNIAAIVVWGATPGDTITCLTGSGVQPTLAQHLFVPSTGILSFYAPILGGGIGATNPFGISLTDGSGNNFSCAVELYQEPVATAAVLAGVQSGFTLPTTDLSDGTPGSAPPATALQIAGTDGTDLRVPLTDSLGHLLTAGYLWKPASGAYEAARTPDAFYRQGLITANATPVAIWTPASGNKFRVTGGLINVGASCKQTTAGYAFLGLADGSGSNFFGTEFFIGTTAGTTLAGGFVIPVTFPGDGYPSTTANNAVEASITGASGFSGQIAVTLWGNEAVSP